MLFIDKDAPNVIKARMLHVKKASCRIRRRIGCLPCSDVSCDICKVKAHRIDDIPYKLFYILNDDVFLEMILGGLPEDLYLIEKMIWSELVVGFSWEEYNLFHQARRIKHANRTVEQMTLCGNYNFIYELLFKIFDYDTWFLNGSDEQRYDAYSLALGLDRNTCTYCNRLYTSTMKTRKGKKVMRPTFDHWFSHGEHPLLGLSFHNLIPSCSVCNSSAKGTKQFLLNTHLHPYVDIDSLDNFEYGYHYYKSAKQFEIFIRPKPNSPKVFKTCEDLKLREMYNAHHSELADMIKIKEAYSEKYLDNMINTYSATRLSHLEAYRLAFGVEHDEKDFYRRPLSKFKKDILRKLSLINI